MQSLAGNEDGLFRCLDPAAWDAFHAHSPHGSPFVEDWFLNIVCPEAERWFWCEQGVPLASALVARRGDRLIRQPLPFSAHQGIALSNGIAELPAHKRVTESLRVVEQMIDALAAGHELLSFSFHPDFEDLRPVLWFNYHEPAQGQFELGLRYTGRLALSESSCRQDWLAEARRDRRHDFKKSEACGLVVHDCRDTEVLAALYQKTFLRQGIDIERGQVDMMLRIASRAVELGRGFILVARTASQDPASATVILTDARCAYSLFTANDPEFRNTGANTRLVIEALDRSREMGIPMFDFVGINSPQRGEFKTSFNAAPCGYFEATWVRRGT